MRHRKLNISWIIDVLGPGSPYLLILLDRITWNKPRKIREHPGKNIIYGNLRIEIFENLENPETLGVHFSIFWNSEFLFLKIKSDEFLKFLNSRRRGMTWNSFSIDVQMLGYEFSFDQKTWNENVVNRTNLSIFGQCIPYHQSTYRFPPLHQIGVVP